MAFSGPVILGPDLGHHNETASMFDLMQTFRGSATLPCSIGTQLPPCVNPEDHYYLTLI